MVLLPHLHQREFQALSTLMANAVLTAAATVPQTYQSMHPEFSASITPDSARGDIVIIRDSAGSHQFNLETWSRETPHNFQALASLFYNLRDRHAVHAEEQALLDPTMDKSRHSSSSGHDAADIPVPAAVR